MARTTNADGKSPSNGQFAHQDLVARKMRVGGFDNGVALTDADATTWQSWKEHLKERKSPDSLATLTSTKGLTALLWGLPAEIPRGAREFFDHMDAALRKGKSRSALHPEEYLSPWLAEAGHASSEAGFPVEALACAHALPILVKRIDQVLWCDVLSLLIDVARDAAGVSLERDPLVHQLLCGELPLTLAHQLPEITACRKLAKPARKAISEGILTLLDGEGLPHGKYVAHARALLACWTRCALLGKHMKKRSLDESAQEQYEWLVRQTLRLARPNGDAMLAAPGSSAGSKALLATALALGGDAVDRRIAAISFSRKPVDPGKSRRLPEAGVTSEWAQLAMLRANWDAESPRLLVNYSQAMATELCAGRDVFWSGECQPQVTVNGRLLQMNGAWEEICWHSDEDVDYLELEVPLESDWKVQRQFVLARNDHFLFIADALSGPNEQDVDYQCAWPVEEGLKLAFPRETTECAVVARKRKINVLPLALPEWRQAAGRRGELSPVDNRLVFRLRQHGRRLYAPLFIDLHPVRVKKELTWRALSVGADRQTCRPDVAVGYRVQAGPQQWLIYRSLAAVASRTVLGQNTFQEFSCGRFACDGEFEALIEVE